MNKPYLLKLMLYSVCIFFISYQHVFSQACTVSASADTAICYGNAATLSAGGAHTYSWSNGFIGNTISVSPSTTTTYSVIGTDTLLACSDTAYITVTVNDLPFVNFTFTPSTSVCQGTVVTLFGNGANTYLWTGGIVDGGSFTPITSTTYMVTGTDGNGCSNTAQITVTVKPLPNVNASAPVSICAGQSTLLTATGAHIYTWNPGSINGSPASVSPAATTTYTVTGTNIITGCSNTASTMVTVNPLPIVNYVANPNDTVCSGTAVTLFGTGANSYIWTGGITNGVPFTPALSNTYTVTGTDVAGCTNTATANIIVHATPVVGYVLSPNDTVCNGTNVTLSGTGASTYIWTGGITNAIPFSATASAIYTVTGTNINGCTNTSSATLVVNPVPVLTVTPGTNLCLSDSVALTVSGADTYVWNPGSFTGSAIIVSPTSTTTYTVTGTFIATGCTGTASTTITINSLPVVGYVASLNDTICMGSNVTLSGTGANTYTWTGGITDATAFIPASSGTYTVTGTDINGCSNTAMANIVVNPLPVIAYTVSPNDTVCLGNDITLSGTGANTYTWTGGVLNGIAFAPASSGTYTVTGTDINGCSNTATANIVVNPRPIVGYTLSPNDTVCGGSTIILTGTGANTYTWTGGILNGIAFVPVSSGSYTVTGMSMNGCTNTATASITLNTSPTAGVIVSPGISICTGTAVTLTGSGATTYSWDNGVVDGVAFTPLATNTYTLIGTNGIGCTDTVTITVTVNPLPTISFTISPNDTVCPGSPVILNGSGPDTYTWTGGVMNGVPFNPVTTNTYSVTVTDINGCSDTSTATIFVYSTLSTIAGSNSPVCFGSNINLSSTGSGTYSWTGPNSYTSTQQNPSIIFSSLLNDGNYIATVTDSIGCQSIDTVDVSVIVQPTGLITPSPSTNLCLGDTVTLTSSVGSMGYLWDNGATTSSITVNPVVSTTYALTMINPPFCNGTVMDFIHITVFNNPIGGIVSSANDTVCSGSNVSLTANGGSSYIWSTGDLQATVSVVPVTDTIYSVIIMSAQGCMDTVTLSIATLTNPTPPVITASSMVICNIGNVELYANPTNNISWSPSLSTNDTLTVNTPGMYQLQYTDANGCTSSSTINITQNVVAASIIGDTIVCPGSVDLLTATGGVSYIWNTLDTLASINVQPLVPTLYSVQVTDVFGCFASTNTMVYPFAFLNMYPIATMDSLTIVENVQGYVDITLNDSNYSSVSVITSTVNGTSTLNLTTIEYISSPGYSGMDSLQYVICSSVCSQACDTAWLFIKVTATADVIIPQVITPNGDNFNDTWIIANIHLFPDNEVIIMNRWGDIVYQVKPYTNDWVGQSNSGIQFGSNLSTGTYFYIVKLNADLQPIKGFIELIK